jgi:hypothetical protein
MEILIVTQGLKSDELDPHAVVVHDELTSRGVKVDILNTDTIDEDSYLWFQAQDNHVSTQLYHAAHLRDIESYDCIWARRFTAHPLKLPRPDELTWSYQNEVFPNFFRNMLIGLRTRVVNRPENVLQADKKITQLQCASTIGLNIPDTLVTNNPLRVRDFFKTADKLVLKSLSQTIATSSQNVFFMTQLITMQWVEQNRQGLCMAPAIFQKFIEKRCEYRVTIFGNRVFTARIEAGSPDTDDYLDWRNYQKSTKWSACSLSQDIEAKLLTFMHRLGLEYAMFDLIHGEDDQIYFLECNPNGQWLFVELLTQQPLVEACCDLLMEVGVSIPFSRTHGNVDGSQPSHEEFM